MGFGATFRSCTCYQNQIFVVHNYVCIERFSCCCCCFCLLLLVTCKIPIYLLLLFLVGGFVGFFRWLVCFGVSVIVVVVVDKSAPKKRKEEVTLTTLHNLFLFHSSLMEQNSL